jgi:hypothetical protein
MDAARRIPGTDRYRVFLNDRPPMDWCRRFLTRASTTPATAALQLEVDGSTITFTIPDDRPSLQVLVREIDPLIAAANLRDERGPA